MNTYIQVIIKNISAEQSDILVAQLTELGFEGFEQTENHLSAYILKQQLPEEELTQFLSSANVDFSLNEIPPKNWNAEWEKNFEPVRIDDFVYVKAAFHDPVENVEHEILITPKMSFGTGHHATTYMMVQQMREIDFKDKKVLDFGTGTGILAIISEKLDALSVTAIDNDEWSILNAQENIDTNNCSRISLSNTELSTLAQQFDIILANINKNVISHHFPLIVTLLKKNGFLLVSGLLETDENDILEGAKAVLLEQKKRIIREGWVCILFTA
jgi:ribosomal protein L11 methyltransferase